MQKSLNLRKTMQECKHTQESGMDKYCRHCGSKRNIVTYTATTPPTKEERLEELKGDWEYYMDKYNTIPWWRMFEQGRIIKKLENIVYKIKHLDD